MRGIDALAAACAPAEDPAAAQEQNNISEAMCDKIAEKVLQRLQAGLTDTEKPEKEEPEKEDPEPAEAPEEGENTDGTCESL